jgi:hypothetical protein
VPRRVAPSRRVRGPRAEPSRRAGPDPTGVRARMEASCPRIAWAVSAGQSRRVANDRRARRFNPRVRPGSLPTRELRSAEAPSSSHPGAAARARQNPVKRFAIIQTNCFSGVHQSECTVSWMKKP